MDLAPSFRHRQYRLMRTIAPWLAQKQKGPLLRAFLKIKRMLSSGRWAPTPHDSNPSQGQADQRKGSRLWILGASAASAASGAEDAAREFIRVAASAHVLELDAVGAGEGHAAGQEIAGRVQRELKNRQAAFRETLVDVATGTAVGRPETKVNVLKSACQRGVQPSVPHA